MNSAKSNVALTDTRVTLTISALGTAPVRQGGQTQRPHTPHRGAARPRTATTTAKKRHRLNPRGDRQLNHAIHMAAVTQVGHNTPGRVYYLRKQAEGKTRKEALRALKRRVQLRQIPA